MEFPVELDLKQYKFNLEVYNPLPIIKRLNICFIKIFNNKFYYRTITFFIDIPNFQISYHDSLAKFIGSL